MRSGGPSATLHRHMRLASPRHQRWQRGFCALWTSQRKQTRACASSSRVMQQTCIRTHQNPPRGDVFGQHVHFCNETRMPNISVTCKACAKGAKLSRRMLKERMSAGTSRESLCQSWMASPTQSLMALTHCPIPQRPALPLCEACFFPLMLDVWQARQSRRFHLNGSNLQGLQITTDNGLQLKVTLSCVACGCSCTSGGG